MKNIVTEMKNTLERISSKPNDIGGWIRRLEHSSGNLKPGQKTEEK